MQSSNGGDEKGRRKPPISIRRDQRGAVAVESALVVGPFLMLLFMIIEVGIYFILHSALDTGVLLTAESLQTSMAAGSAFSPPTAATLKTTIASNGGPMLSIFPVTVDVRQLATLSSSAPVTADGTTSWGGSGSVLVVRAQATMWLLPTTSVLTVTSTSIVNRSLY